MNNDPTTMTTQLPPPVGEPQLVTEANNSGMRRRLIAAGAALAITFGGAAALASCGDDGEAGDVPAGVDADELRDLLTVESTGFDCEVDGAATGTIETAELSDGSKSVISRVNAESPVDSTIRTQDNRLWSDSMANALTTAEYTDENKATLLDEFSATICEDPLVASQVANHFANMDVNGVKVLDLNPWLNGYEGDASVINDNATELMPQFGKDVANMTDEEVVAAYEARQQHTELAEKLATLLSRFENSGIEDNLTTIFNYHLEAGGLVAGQIPEVALNDAQYTGNFLVLRLTLKDGRCLDAFVINPNDQRTGEAAEVCVVSAPPKPPVEDTVPGTTPGTPPPTTPPETTPSSTIPDGRKVPGTTIAATDNTSAPNTNIGDDYDDGNPPATAAPDSTPDDIIIIDSVPVEDEQKGTEEPERDDEPQPDPTIAPPATTPDFEENDGDDSDNNSGTVVVNR